MDELPVIAELLRPSVQVVDRALGNADPGAVHATARRVFEPRPPSRPDFENMIPGSQPQLFVTVVELPDGRDIERLRITRVNALRVAGRLGIKETEEKLR